MWGFTVRGSWRPNINCNILTPLLWPSRCVFLVLLMLNRRPRGSPCCVMAFFIAFYQHLLRTSAHQGPGPLRPGVAFPTTSPLHSTGTRTLWPELNWNRNSIQLARRTANCPCHCQLPQLPSWLRYIIVQRLHDRPLDLWNRMFYRHQAEISVMQPISAHAISSPNCH